MSEREPDDTPGTDCPPTPRGGRKPGDYYDDDATGYETYKPEEDDDNEARGSDGTGG